MERRNKFYVAAPFFNPVQLHLVELIEEALDGAGLDYFSPRSLPENAGGGPLDDVRAASIFRKDVAQLLVCDSMIAVVDWMLPEGQQVRVGHQRDESWQPIITVPPLNIPDSGTVYEMGFEHCRTMLAQRWFQSGSFNPITAVRNAMDRLTGKHVDEMAKVLEILTSLAPALTPCRTVVYTDRPPEAGLNLMLTQGASGVVNGITELRAFLGKNGSPNWDALKPWRGKHR